VTVTFGPIAKAGSACGGRTIEHFAVCFAGAEDSERVSSDSR